MKSPCHRGTRKQGVGGKKRPTARKEKVRHHGNAIPPEKKMIGAVPSDLTRKLRSWEKKGKIPPIGGGNVGKGGGAPGKKLIVRRQNRKGGKKKKKKKTVAGCEVTSRLKDIKGGKTVFSLSTRGKAEKGGAPAGKKGGLCAAAAGKKRKKRLGQKGTVVKGQEKQDYRKPKLGRKRVKKRFFRRKGAPLKRGGGVLKKKEEKSFLPREGRSQKRSHLGL